MWVRNNTEKMCSVSFTVLRNSKKKKTANEVKMLLPRIIILRKKNEDTFS